MTEVDNPERRAFLRGVRDTTVGGILVADGLLWLGYNHRPNTEPAQGGNGAQASESLADLLFASFGNYVIDGHVERATPYKQIGAQTMMFSGDGRIHLKDQSGGIIRDINIQTSEPTYYSVSGWQPQWGITPTGFLFFDTPGQTSIHAYFGEFPTTHSLRADQNCLSYLVGGGLDPVTVELRSSNVTIADFTPPRMSNPNDNPAPLQQRNDDISPFVNERLHLTLHVQGQGGTLGTNAYFSSLQVGQKPI